MVEDSCEATELTLAMLSRKRKDGCLGNQYTWEESHVTLQVLGGLRLAPALTPNQLALCLVKLCFPRDNKNTGQGPEE